MAKNLYQILDVNQDAVETDLRAHFESERKRLQAEFDAGDETAREQLWALKGAFETLSNPANRIKYDYILKCDKIVPCSGKSDVYMPDEVSATFNFFVVIVMVCSLVGLGMYLGRQENAVQKTVQTVKANVQADRSSAKRKSESASIH